MRSYLGLDIGTSGCKAAAFDETGRMVSLARRDYDLNFTSDGGAELDSDLVMEHCLAVVAEARAQAGDEVRAMAVSSQGEAFTAVGADGQALCHAMVSSDTRAADHARNWPKEFGEDRLYQITGHTAHPMFTLFKLLWLKEHRPDVWQKAVRFLCFEDLLHLRLGLEPAMGWPLAGRTMLFDVRRHQWSGEILEAVGCCGRQLSRPLMSGSVVGQTKDGMLVVTGGHDQTCGALGVGVTHSGVAMYATGTVDCITPVFAQPAFSEVLRQSNLCTYDHAVPGLYATVAFSLTGGNLLKWFRSEFGNGRTYEELLAELPAEPSRLLVLPYWTASGTPYFDCATPGAILGLRLSTSRGQILRALLEGLAFEMRLNLNLLQAAGCPIRELLAIGGGAQSAIWNQLKADVLDLPLIRSEISEAGCMGAAMLAYAADTQQPVSDIARAWVKLGGQFSPNRAHANFYTNQFAHYRKLRPTLRKLAGWK